jgi:hypothetical protein
LLSEDGYIDSFTSLIFLDLSRDSFRKLHTIEYPYDRIEIFPNKSDPTTFILRDLNSHVSQIYKIVDKTIIIGDAIDISLFPNYFYGKCLYTLDWYDRDGDEDEDDQGLEVRILYLSG